MLRLVLKILLQNHIAINLLYNRLMGCCQIVDFWILIDKNDYWLHDFTDSLNFVGMTKTGSN